MKRNIIVISIAIIAAISIVFASVSAYEQHLDTVATQRAQQAIKEAQAAKLKSAQDAQYQAGISRLVSICIESQQRYDALTPALKAKEVRPDCSVPTAE